MNTQSLYTKTPPFKLFLLASVPGAISMLASALYTMVDGILVGRFLGETAFAALNLAFPFVVINFALADLIGVGSAVPIAISLGRGEEREANNIFTGACLMIVGTGIVFATDNYLRICGKIRTSMFLNLLMSALSAGLEFLFLFVLRWGIWSAALGTCLGMGVCALIALLLFARGNLQLRFCRPRFRAETIRRIISCGSPNFLNNIAGRVTSIFLSILLVRFGGERAVSVYGILMYAEAFILPLLYGMCDSLQPAVDYNWGAGRFTRVRAIERCCFTASGILSVLCAAGLFLFPDKVAGLFVSPSDTTGLLEAAIPALRLFSLTYLTRWFSFAAQSYMLAVGKPVPASVISVSTALVFPVLLIAALWPLGLTGIWLNFAGTSALAAALAGIVLVRQRRSLHRPDLEQK